MHTNELSCKEITLHQPTTQDENLCLSNDNISQIDSPPPPHSVDNNVDHDDHRSQSQQIESKLEQKKENNNEKKEKAKCEMESSSCSSISVKKNEKDYNINQETILEVYISSVNNKQVEFEKLEFRHNKLKELFNTSTCKIIDLKEKNSMLNEELKSLRERLDYKSKELVRTLQDMKEIESKNKLLENKVKSYNELTEKIMKFKANSNKRNMIVPTSSVDKTYKMKNKKSKLDTRTEMDDDN